MDKAGVFGEILEQGQSLTDKTGKAVKKQIADTAKAAVSQVAGSGTQADQPGQNQPPTADKNFVKDLYGIKDKKQPKSSQLKPPSQTSESSSEEVQDQKKIEEQQKLAKLRQELHQTTYYEPLINPKKEKPEERPAEKVEQEKQEEQFELQQKEKEKPAPLAVKRAQTSTEINRGVSG